MSKTVVVDKAGWVREMVNAYFKAHAEEIRNKITLIKRETTGILAEVEAREAGR